MINAAGVKSSARTASPLTLIAERIPRKQPGERIVLGVVACLTQQLGRLARDATGGQQQRDRAQGQAPVLGRHRPLGDQGREQRADHQHSAHPPDPSATGQHSDRGRDQPQQGHGRHLPSARPNHEHDGHAGQRLLHPQPAIVGHDQLHDPGQPDHRQGDDRRRGVGVHAGIDGQQHAPGSGQRYAHPRRVTARADHSRSGIRGREHYRGIVRWAGIPLGVRRPGLRGPSRLRCGAVSSTGRARDFSHGAPAGKPLVSRQLFAGTP